MDTEKITINLGAVDLGKVDVLVDEGFYSNRTDFIRTAIRNQLAKHEQDTAASMTRRAMAAGAMHLSRKDLEASLAAGRRLTLSVVGVLSLAHDVTPGLARDAIESVKVRGIFRADKAVKEALLDRTS